MNKEERLIGESPFITNMRKEIPRLAKADQILITGEEGTGKSLLADLIQNSSKSRATLIRLIPQFTSEEEIKGAIEKATAGTTIVVQDIEKFSFLTQDIIIAAIKNFPKKGAPQIIVTCNKNLNELAINGNILEDVKNILSSFRHIEVPSLHERAEDLPVLVSYFIKNACENVNIKLKAIDINALDFLSKRKWKENIHELKNVIEKSVLTSKYQTLELPADLIDEHAQVDGMVAYIRENKAFEFDRSLANLEKSLIERTLAMVGFNQVKAAKLLNISDSNLRYRLRKFKILSTRKRTF